MAAEETSSASPSSSAPVASVPGPFVPVPFVPVPFKNPTSSAQLGAGGRPADDDLVPVDVQLAWQEDYCRSHGAPTAALMLEAVRDDLRRGGICADVLPAQTRFGDLIGLRIMAAIHLLAIERAAPQVALHAATLGGTAPDLSANPARERIRFRAAVVETIARHPERIRQALGQVPQTNEVGRSIPLRIALSYIAATSQGDAISQGWTPNRPRPSQAQGIRDPSTCLPVRLLEIGASAGLNLRADHLPGESSLEFGPMPRITERLGCDLNPIDPTTTAGRARLTSYIWLDDLIRFERLREALDVAARIPAKVVQEDALAFVESLELKAGSAAVLWHSAMWIYLAPPTRAAIEQQILRLGHGANPDQPFWHICWEWSLDHGQPNPACSTNPASSANGESSPPKVTSAGTRTTPKAAGTTAAGVGDTFNLIARRWIGSSEDGNPIVLATGTSHGRSVRIYQ